MKRSRLTRKTPLKAKGKSRFPKRRNPEYLAWIRTLPCCVWHVRTGDRVPIVIGDSIPETWVARIEAAHVKSRGAGGWDVGNTVPLDMLLHTEQHRIGIKSFEAKYGVDLSAIAQQLATQYEEGRCSG